jgi:hypothetical protein
MTNLLLNATLWKPLQGKLQRSPTAVGMWGTGMYVTWKCLPGSVIYLVFAASHALVLQLRELLTSPASLFDFQVLS